MKHFIGFFLTLSIFSFIAFGISVAVLGTEPVTSALTSEYTELTGSYNDIEITTNFANIAIYPGDGDSTKIFTTERLAKSVSAEIKDDKLIIKLDHGANIFNDFIGFFTSLFDGGNKDCVKVYVPNEIYDSLKVDSNAGSTEIIDIGAESVELDLSAGNLTYAQPEGAAAQELKVHLSAGNCTVYNAKSEKFDIDMSAGNIDVYGLCGAGDIDVSAGNGQINMAEVNGNINIDVSAGNLDLNMPDGVNATIGCDKSAGSVKVDYYDTSKDMNDSDKVVLGSGEYNIFADVSAGDIKFTDNVKDKENPSVPDMPETPSGAVATTAISTVTEADEPEIKVEVGDVEVDESDVRV